MQMIAHSPERAKQLGVSQSVGKDFVNATPAVDRSRWAKPGSNGGDKKKKKKNGIDNYGISDMGSK